MGVPPDDLPDLAGAIADELRLNSAWNCVSWEGLLAAAASTADGLEPLTYDASRVDVLRNRQARLGGMIDQYLSRLEPVVVLRTPVADRADEYEGAWHELRRRIESPAVGIVRQIRLATVEPSELHEHDAMLLRQAGRSMIEAVFSSRTVSESALNAVSGPGARSTATLLDAVLECAASGVIRKLDGTVDAELGAPSAPPQVRVEPESLSATDGRTFDGGDVRKAQEACSSPEMLLDEVERRLSVGDASSLLESCVRVQEVMKSTGGASTASVMRLVDLWVECGNADAADEVLTEWRGDESNADIALRRMRVICAQGRLGALRGVLDLVAVGSVSPAQRAEFARFEGLACLGEGRLRDAYRCVRRALRLGRTVGTAGRIWPLITMGNVLRARGRRYSAGRSLRAARDRASATGSVRAGLIAAANLLQVAAPNLAPAQVASEAGGLAARCRSWGMHNESLTLVLTSASWWIIAGEPHVAQRMLEQGLAASGEVGRGETPLRRSLHRRWLEAMDLAEDWANIGAISEDERSDAPGSIDWMHTELLRAHTGLAQDAAVVEASVVSPCEEFRAYRLAARLSTSEGEPLRRLARVMRLLDDAISVESPLVGHVARSLIRLPRSRSMERALLDASRQLLDASRRPTPLASAIAILGLVWTERPDEMMIQWTSQSLSGDERRRPPGVRRWEWQAAMLIVGRTTGQRNLGETSIEAVLVEVESALGALPVVSRNSYSCSLPYAAFANAAGLSWCAQPDADAPRAESGTWKLTVFRAMLSRRGVESVSAGARAAGLERVLQGALKLRSSGDLESVVVGVATGVLSVCRAERAVVIYEVGGKAARAKVATADGVVDMPEGAAEVSRTALERVRVSGRACIIDDACGDGELGDRPSVLEFRPRSLMIAPMKVHGKAMGFIYVENRSVARSFAVSDSELIEGFAAQAALALDNSQLVEELRASCESLATARSEAVRAESLRVLGRMASEVAHDFNNLLTAILGETQLLLEDVADSRVHEALVVIERAALDGATAIRRIQDSTRVRTDRVFAPLEVGQTIRDAVCALRTRASTSGVAVAIQDVDGGTWVNGVASEIREVLANLLGNSVDASPPGSTVRIRWGRRDEWVDVSIEDRGCGMSADTVARIFDPFFSTKGEQGNGLGLSIAYGVVRRHGGTISVRSELGRGTEMIVSLPAVSGPTVTSGSEGDGVRGTEARRPRVGGATALVVDDEASVARVLVGMLERLGVTAETASGAREAVSRLQDSSRRFDFVFTDRGLPELEGAAVTRAASRLAVTPRMIMMTGAPDRDNLVSGEFGSGVQVLCKPFTFDDLATIMTRYCESREVRTQIATRPSGA